MVLTGLRERFGLFEQEKKVTKRQNTSTKGKTDLFMNKSFCFYFIKDKILK